MFNVFFKLNIFKDSVSPNMIYSLPSSRHPASIASCFLLTYFHILGQISSHMPITLHTTPHYICLYFLRQLHIAHPLCKFCLDLFNIKFNIIELIECNKNLTFWISTKLLVNTKLLITICWLTIGTFY